MLMHEHLPLLFFPTILIYSISETHAEFSNPFLWQNINVGKLKFWGEVFNKSKSTTWAILQKNQLSSREKWLFESYFFLKSIAAVSQRPKMQLSPIRTQSGEVQNILKFQRPD